MQWTKPDFEEISLGMEVTAYVYTDDGVTPAEPPARAEANSAAATTAIDRPA
jgi:coenzyme PQQ precursor peptide PqqA